MKNICLLFFYIILSSCQPKQESRTVSKEPAVPPHADRLKSVERIDVKVQPVEDGITIAELFAHKDTYAGKSVKIRGQVTKFNARIMKKNWIHLQDGTGYSGKFDLTANCNVELAVAEGEIITLEGKIALNKDFGSGYFYDVLLEDARLIK